MPITTVPEKRGVSFTSCRIAPPLMGVGVIQRITSVLWPRSSSASHHSTRIEDQVRGHALDEHSDALQHFLGVFAAGVVATPPTELTVYFLAVLRLNCRSIHFDLRHCSRSVDLSTTGPALAFDSSKLSGRPSQKLLPSNFLGNLNPGASHRSLSR
jgi:hypothetical protein